MNQTVKIQTVNKVRLTIFGVIENLVPHPEAPFDMVKFRPTVKMDFQITRQFLISGSCFVESCAVDNCQSNEYALIGEISGSSHNRSVVYVLSKVVNNIVCLHRLLENNSSIPITDTTICVSSLNQISLNGHKRNSTDLEFSLLFSNSRQPTLCGLSLSLPFGKMGIAMFFRLCFFKTWIIETIKNG